LREINTREYKKILREHPEKEGDLPEDNWLWYITESSFGSASMLRNHFLASNEYDECAASLARSFPVFRAHIHDSEDTTRVLTELRRRGSKETVVDILKKEKRKYLLTYRQMSFINDFVKATGNIEFPFISFVREGVKYAIPQIRTDDDLKLCTTLRCQRSSG
jgi:hypothetical protein